MVGKVVGKEKGVGRTQIMNIFKENVRFNWRFWKQCFQFNIVLLEIVLLFIKYLSLFICMFYSNHIRLR